MSLRVPLRSSRGDIYDVMADEIVSRGSAPKPPAPDARGRSFRVKLHPPPEAAPVWRHLVREGVRTCAGKLAHIKEADCLRRDNDQGECVWCGRWAWLAYCSTSCEDAMQAHIQANMQIVGPGPCWSCGDRLVSTTDGFLCDACSLKHEAAKLPRGDGAPW